MKQPEKCNEINVSIIAHGTFIGTLKIESHKPTQLQINSTFHFGASTRYYTLRERPSAGSRSGNIMEDIPMSESGEGALLGLPESQTELDVSIPINCFSYINISVPINSDCFRISLNIIRHIIAAYQCWASPMIPTSKRYVKSPSKYSINCTTPLNPLTECQQIKAKASWRHF